MDESVRAEASELCVQLIATKHDIVHELSEVDDFVDNGASDARMALAIGHVIDRLWDDIRRRPRIQSDPEIRAFGWITRRGGSAMAIRGSCLCGGRQL